MDIQNLRGKAGNNDPDSIVNDNEYNGASPWFDICTAREKMDDLPTKVNTSDRSGD